ncbi:MAG: tetratricopeptide repeat protein [Candidatus Heimdallarchaeota archaeon]
MIFPKAFQLYETRLSKDSLDAIEFQFERLDQDSSNIHVFFNRFLKISKSPTLPPEDTEIIYLASKIAYFQSQYDFFKTEEFKSKEYDNDGARIWYALALAVQGQMDEAIHILEDIKEKIENDNDHLQFIECLGVLAQIYFVRGTEDKEKLEAILERIAKFEEENKGKLPDFDHKFMPAYLIENRVKSQQLSPTEIINEITPVYELAEEVSDHYWMTHFELDLALSNILSRKLDEANNYLTKVFTTFKTLKYLALEAKAIRIKGQLIEKQGDIATAEKTYLEAKKAYEKLNDRIGVSICLTLLAQLAENNDQQNKAEQYFTKSYNLSEDMKDFYGMAVALTSLAKISYKHGQYAEALATFKKVLDITQKNSFDYLLPKIYDGLAHVDFISGDFWSAVENRSRAIIYKLKFEYSEEDLLIDRMKLGQLNAIVGNLDSAFNEFEDALNYCTKLNIKNDIYFDILNWLFEISTAIGKLALAEAYMSRADLFASIHDSEEENVQALISKIRFHIQKKELVQAEKLLETVFEKAQEFPSALTMALALVEKAVVQIMNFQEKKDDSIMEEVLQTMDDMLFISLDLEFLPLTMYTKKVLGKVLAYKNDIEDGIEELTEAIELADELGMEKFTDSIKKELKELKKLDKKDLSEEQLAKKRETYLNQGIEYLKETFWLVSASEYQTE